MDRVVAGVEPPKLKRAQPLHEAPQTFEPIVLSARLPVPTFVPVASTMFTPMVSASLPLRQPTQTQSEPPVTVEPLELQPSWLAGWSAQGCVVAVNPSATGVGAAEAPTEAGADGAPDGARLAPTEALGAVETSALGDGEPTAAPPEKSPP